MSAKYKHDCKSCQYRGYMHSNGRRSDIYVCVQPWGCSVVIRRSDIPNDYWSCDAEVLRSVGGMHSGLDLAGDRVYCAEQLVAFSVLSEEADND